MGSINSNNLVYYINYIQVHTIVIGNPDSHIVKPGRFHSCFPHFLESNHCSASFWVAVSNGNSMLWGYTGNTMATLHSDLVGISSHIII